MRTPKIKARNGQLSTVLNVPVREAQLIRLIEDYLRLKGAWVLKTHGHRGRTGSQRVGVPDLLVCYDGLFLGIEAKGPRGVVSPYQLKEILAIEEAGGIGLIAHSLEDVMKALESRPSIWMEIDKVEESRVEPDTHRADLHWHSHSMGPLGLNVSLNR